MTWSVEQLLGIVAGAFIIGALIPQAYRLFKLKSAKEISMTFTLLYMAGSILWLCYGIWLGLLPVILWNSIGICINIAMLIAKLKYGR
jgi:MtN3 and saliva related transmembrane protein